MAGGKPRPYEISDDVCFLADLLSELCLKAAFSWLGKGSRMLEHLVCS